LILKTTKLFRDKAVKMKKNEGQEEEEMIQKHGPHRGPVLTVI